MGWRGSIAAALTVAVITAAADDAQAFCRTTTCDPNKPADHCRIDEHGCTRSGAPLSWRELPIAYRFHAKGSAKVNRDDAREAVRAAFQRWTDVTCPSGRRTSLRFKEEDDIVATMPESPHARGAQHFGIYFRDDKWSAKDADSTLALTTQTFGLVNGYVDQSDIEINTTTETFATSDAEKGVDLQAVLTHEVGHYIGLAHSKDPDSIMVARYCQSGERCDEGKTDARRLSNDDRAAVCALFPPSGIAGVAYVDPDAGSACSAAPSSAGLSRATWLPLCAAAFVIAALRRRARRFSSE